MYASPKERSYDLTYFHGGTLATPADTEKSLDLPKSVYLAKANPVEKKFSIRVDLHSKYIEIPLSMAQLKEWFDKIEKEDAIALEEERESERQEMEYEKLAEDRESQKNAVIDMGEQEKGELNWFNTLENIAKYDQAHGEDGKKCELKCTLTPSTYDHAGECLPSKEKCQYCYKYWCGKCGNGISNYMVKCCW
jgi:hypothetical protein